MKQLFSLLVLTLTCLSQAPLLGTEPTLPSVELNYSQMSAREWAALRFRDIIPPTEIKRIIRISERGFAHHNNARKDCKTLVQADYDALMAHLVASERKVTDLALDAQERCLASLVVLTTTGEIYHLQVLGKLGQGVSAVTFVRPDRGARIEIKGFRRSARRK